MTETSREPIRMLVFAASLQENSLNAKLAMLATSVIEQHQGVAQLATMKDFDCPSFDADVEETSGLPDGAEMGPGAECLRSWFGVVGPSQLDPSGVANEGPHLWRHGAPRGIVRWPVPRECIGKAVLRGTGSDAS